MFRPRLWESSETLYVNLDVRTAQEDAIGDGSRSLSGMPRRGRDHCAAADRGNVLVKTHDLPFASRELRERLHGITNSREVTTLYPFRQMSSTLTSFHAHQNDRGGIREFLDRRDPFLGTSLSVIESMLEHGEWGLRNAVPIDIEDLQLRPHAYGEALASRFGWNFSPPANPLPPKRILAGTAGELVERIRGRLSTEVVVRAKPLPRASAAFVDREGPLADLYGALKAKAFSPL